MAAMIYSFLEHIKLLTSIVVGVVLFAYFSFTIAAACQTADVSTANTSAN